MPTIAGFLYVTMQGAYTCDLCGMEFDKLSKYKAHLRYHEDDKPHRCPQCSQTYAIPENLRLHMALHDENNLTCPECDKNFSRLASFKQHLTIHVREELFVCPECSDEFQSKVC